MIYALLEFKSLKLYKYIHSNSELLPTMYYIRISRIKRKEAEITAAHFACRRRAARRRHGAAHMYGAVAPTRLSAPELCFCSESSG